MKPFFCFDDIVPFKWLVSIGACKSIDGLDIRSDVPVWPTLTVLPMGFSWSFWVVQELVSHLVQQSGVSRDRFLLGSRPPPELSKGLVTNP